MFSKSKYKLLVVFLAIGSFCTTYSQTSKSIEKNKRLFEKLTFFDLRGTNALDVALGSSVINGDLMEPEFEIYFRGGYKRHITSHININVSYNKYNVSYKDVYFQGYMSFDLNLEYLLAPFNKFTPFIYAGGGYNAANYFENTSTKAQGGFGIEYIVIESVGLKLFGEYNYLFSDELDGLILGETDDAFWRAGLGINLYFGGKKKKEKRLREIETVINSNLID